MAGLSDPQLTHASAEALADPGLPPSPGLLRRGLSALLDLIFPPRCAACGRVDTRWCHLCSRELQAYPLDTLVRTVPPLAGVVSTAPHLGKVQDAVHALKYDGARASASPLAERLAARLGNTNWRIDTVVPVPLYSGRARARGYNQSQLLAEGLAELLMLPCTSTAVTRWRDTPPQVGLSAAERRQNVQDAFHALPDALAGRAVLLVDDVHTTGATLSACAQAVLEAGAATVYGITVSVAL